MDANVEEFFNGKQHSDEPAASDSPQEPVVEPEPAKEPAAAKKQEAADADEEKDEPLPRDVEALQRTVLAIRGDRRRERKKWREVEQAFQEERKQREEERRRYAMLEGELRGMRQQQPQGQAKQEPKTDLDEEFYSAGPGKFWESREQQLERRFNERLIEADRRAMRRTAEDYDAAEAAFVAAAQSDPSLAHAMRASGDPVGFAYERGKELLKLQELGATSITELEAKIRAQVEAELRGQPSGQASGQPASQPSARPPIPSKSIAGARGSGAGATREWAGPRDASTFFTGPRI